jgi:hypothetical protein
MALNRVGRQSNQLDPTLAELGLEFCKCAQFGGADWSVVLGM